MASVVFYISGHGFGHASRQIEVMNTLGALAPDLELVIRTSAPRWLFDRTLRVPVTFLAGPCDTGVVQIDSLRLDDAATIRDADAFHRNLPALAATEAAMLSRHDARLVIADAPPLASAAAHLAGVPSVILSNFTWDWIYEAYAGPLAAAPRLIPAIQEAYARASAGWRLPLAGGFATVPGVVDLPFIARHASHAGARTREILGLPADRPLALSSFGGYGVRGLDMNALDCLDRYTVVLTGPTRLDSLPAGVHLVEKSCIYDAGLRYEDLVAAVDVVVTKPGFGIIAECVANRTAMLYTSRGCFREYDVMVAGVPRILRCRFISQDDLFAGRWREALDQLLEQSAPPEQPATNGAQVAAAKILELLEH